MLAMAASMNLLLGFFFLTSISRALLSSSRELVVSPSGISGKKIVSNRLGFLRRLLPVPSVETDSAGHPATRNFCLKFPILKLKLNFQQYQPHEVPGSFKHGCFSTKALATLSICSHDGYGLKLNITSASLFRFSVLSL